MYTTLFDHFQDLNKLALILNIIEYFIEWIIMYFHSCILKNSPKVYLTSANVIPYMNVWIEL